MKNISLFLVECAAKKILDHCYEKGRKEEVLGLLIDETYKDKNKDNNNVFSIAKDVVTSDLDATDVSVRFSSFEKLFHELDRIDYEYQIIGWYHSHPSYTSFMSPKDIDTQKKMFKLPHQNAIVIDPISLDMKAYALDKFNNDKIIESGYAIV